MDYANSKDRYRFYNNHSTRNVYSPRMFNQSGYNGGMPEIRPASVATGLLENNNISNSKNFLSVSDRSMLARSPMNLQQDSQREMTNSGIVRNGYYQNGPDSAHSFTSNNSGSVASYDQYYDPYYSSDSTSKHSRSGSSTPIFMQQQQVVI